MPRCGYECLCGIGFLFCNFEARCIDTSTPRVNEFIRKPGMESCKHRQKIYIWKKKDENWNYTVIHATTALYSSRLPLPHRQTANIKHCWNEDECGTHLLFLCHQIISFTFIPFRNKMFRIFCFLFNRVPSLTLDSFSHTHTHIEYTICKSFNYAESLSRWMNKVRKSGRKKTPQCSISL